VLDAGARQYPVMAERAAEPVGEDDRHPLGWQPSRFLADWAEAERAFQLAERLGSVNAAAAELGTTWPSLHLEPPGVGPAAPGPGCRRGRLHQPAAGTPCRPAGAAAAPTRRRLRQDGGRPAGHPPAAADPVDGGLAGLGASGGPPHLGHGGP
jgi:hypothetical protein